jgi:hypothetical protein
MTSEAVSINLSKLKSGSQKRLALEAQLKFRRFVFEAKNTNGTLSLSSKGKKFSIGTLEANLRCALREAEDEVQSIGDGDTP